MEFNKIKIKRSIIYTFIAFLVGFIYLMYAEPKPVESISHIGWVILTAGGYMLGSFLVSVIILSILMIFIKPIKKNFWNFSALLMMGGVKLIVLSSLLI
jgi:hypothetical protein